MENSIKSWRDVEKLSNENGFIPQEVYSENKKKFTVNKSRNPEQAKDEASVWNMYLSTKRTRYKNHNMYSEMYRYGWYEGKKRRGFWGNIEAAVGDLKLGESPSITIFSAGSGRDLLKVGLAAGVWTSIAPKKIKGTCKEISGKYFRLEKPGARIIVTEFDENNYCELKKTIEDLKSKKLLTDEMICSCPWDFRERSPVAKATQDIVVFSLTGNYATIDEQPYILKEIAKSIKPGGHLIASTMASHYSFSTNSKPLNMAKFILSTKLELSIARDFLHWGLNWSKMACKMYEKGYWANASAEIWLDFIAPSGMKKIKIYEGPSKLVPVEVLVAEKIL